MIHESDSRKGKNKKNKTGDWGILRVRVHYAASKKESQQLSDPCTPVMNITQANNRLKAGTEFQA